VQQCSPSNLTELERICREWEKLPKYRSAKLAPSYPKITAVITAKGALTKYWVKGLKMYVNVIFLYLKNIYIYICNNCLKPDLWRRHLKKIHFRIRL
jgi:hypothetical protein